MQNKRLNLGRIHRSDRPMGWAGIFGRACITALLAASLWTVGFTGLAQDNPDLPLQESGFRSAFNIRCIAVTGRILSEQGTPIEGAMVTLDSGERILSQTNGAFFWKDMSRRNRLMSVSKAGYYSHLQPIELFLPLTRTNMAIDPIVLSADTPATIRFLFGGDTAFARRMLDPLERAQRNEMPVENPEALINVTDPLPGTLGVVGFIQPLFGSVDYPVLNFESVVTRDPATPHPTKEFVYFTLPESLPALKSLHLDYVSLGNNHVYDYLENGVRDTQHYLDEAGLHYSGIGTNDLSAFQPYRTWIKNQAVSLLSASSVSGVAHDITYVADHDKGGSAYMGNTALACRTIELEKQAGMITIAQLHVGAEYTHEPTSNALSTMEMAVDAGADLVIGHHPHVAQGFGMRRGVLLAYCLGNLFFDQDRLETMFGLAALVDMEGGRLRSARGVPLYLEDYRPRFFTGNAADRLLRRVGEFSREVKVFPYNGQAWIATGPDQYVFEDRGVDLSVTVSNSGWALIDLREHAGSEESLVLLEAGVPGLSIRPGRDLLQFGDFEEVDVDAEVAECARWDLGTSGFAAWHLPYRGAASLGMTRTSKSTVDAVVALRNRVRALGDATDSPNKDLSLFGYVRGSNAGAAKIVVRYYASEGAAEFGEEIAFEKAAGTYNWQSFSGDLTMPPDDSSRPGIPAAVNARALRLFLRHAPPVWGEALLYLDELAVINWEERLDPFLRPALATPHQRDFLRVEGPPGQYALHAVFRKYRPACVALGPGPKLEWSIDDRPPGDGSIQFQATAVGFSDTAILQIRNPGNAPLQLHQFVLSGANASEFSVQGLSTDGLPLPPPTNMVVFPRTGNALVLRFQPKTSGKKSAALQLGSNDPDHSKLPAQLSLVGEAFSRVPVRSLNRHQTTGREVWEVRLQVPAGLNSEVALEEVLPAGLTPVCWSPEGQWDSESRRLRWTGLAAGAICQYSLDGANGCFDIEGFAEAGSRRWTTLGEQRLVLAQPWDTDQDGLPDYWEQAFFDTRTDALPQGDGDCDGVSNLDEYRLGSHPLDCGFAAQDVRPDLSYDRATLSLQIHGRAGWSYQLETSTNLNDWEVIASRLLPNQPFTVPAAGATHSPALFFRVGAR
jgi:hypothetical protein